ncbi:RHS repeat-associated core domain-containing protein [Nonomuraea sp. NPDC000554]|uniref:RHS repeat-associated core domain-containing protein n=1 Tax=Nonomuraea sp. NPDC000554 TaxID=3154259 RepID=UPI003318C436
MGGSKVGLGLAQQGLFRAAGALFRTRGAQAVLGAARGAGVGLRRSLDAGVGAWQRSRSYAARVRTKDPIDVASGEVVLQQVDVELPGVLPLELERTHVSSYRAGRSFGVSWASTLDQRLEFGDNGVYFAAADGMVLAYPPVRETPVLPEAGPCWPLAADAEGGYTVTDPQAGQTLWFAPDDGRIMAAGDRNGNRIDFDYDPGGRLTGIRHSGGYRIAVHTDDAARVTALRLVSGGQDLDLVRYAYDDAGHLAEVYDSTGHPLRFDYDPEGRLTGWTDRNGHWYRYVYDERGRGVRGHGDGGFLDVTLAYGDLVTVMTDSLGNRTNYHLNDSGQVVAETGPLGHTTRSEWDERDRLLSRTDPLGRTTRCSYDGAGNLTAVVRPDGRRITARYNDLGLPVEVTDADGTVWRQEYDPRGNLVTLTDPAGATSRYAYDERGGLSAVTDPLGAVTRVVNDDAGLPISVTDPLGGTSRCARDPLGRVTEALDPLGGVTHLTWTTEGRLTSVTLPGGETERWSYDGEGNLVTHVDAAGRVSRTEYGPFDVPTARIEQDGARVTFGYDTELRLTAVTDPRGLVWRYVYDPAGNLVQETDYNGRVLGYAYDDAGLLAERVNGAGQTVRYTRDPLGHVVEQRSGDEVATFGYSVTGRLVSAVNADAEVRFEHDALGRVVAEVCNGRRIESAYDAAGRRVLRRTPSGAEAAWEYDAASRHVALHTAGRTLSFAYDASGRETSRRIGPGATLVQDWEPGDRLVRQTLRGTGILQQRTYSYQPDGNLVGTEDRTIGARHFELDAVGRVTGVQAAGRHERYAYDAAGGLVHIDRPGGDTPGAHEYAGARLRSAGQVRYEYDGQGRVVLRRHTDGSPHWRYDWDADDRLVGVTTPGGRRWRYRYDALGRRVAKQRLAPGGRTVVEQTDYTWDDATLAEQATVAVPGAAARTITWDYEPDGVRPLAQTERDGSGRRFYGVVTDLAGSPAELVDDAGEPVWRHVPTLWGGGVPQAREGVDCPLRFPGQYFDAETGLHYNNRRYYDPATARYQSPDHLGLAPQLDPYAYVANPLTWADPLGLAPCPVFFKDLALKFGHWRQKGPRWAVALQLAKHDNRTLNRNLSGTAPAANATVRDLLDLKAGNPQYAGRAAGASRRADAELLQSVFRPRDGQYMAVHPRYPGTILQGNHRRLALIRRAEDPESEITLDTPVFVNNFRRR